MIKSTYPARMGEEVVSHRLDVAVVGGGELTDGLEVLLGGPALGEDWKRQVDLYSGHIVYRSAVVGEEERDDRKYIRLRLSFIGPVHSYQ
jgi:hypothetical protein